MSEEIQNKHSADCQSVLDAEPQNPCDSRLHGNDNSEVPDEPNFPKTHLTVIISCFYIAGVVAFINHSVILFALAGLLLLIVGLFKNLITPKRAVISFLFFALALLNSHFQIKEFDPLSKLAPGSGVITGTVITIPTTNNESRTKFYLRVQSADLSGRHYNNLESKSIVTIYDEKGGLQNIKIGDRIELKGKLRQPMRAVNPSQFDYKNYLKYNKTFTTFYVKNIGGASNWKIISAPKEPAWKFLQKLNNKRQDIIDIHRKYMKSPNIEVLGGVVFGDDAINPPNDVRNSFINSGLLHILAASGMNVSIIFGIWFFIGTRLRMNYRMIILTGAVLVGFYTLMTGMGASVLRAALMIEFVLLGKFINRNADGVALLFFVALLLLLYRPSMLMEVGFQMSFVAAFALMFICPPVLSRIENKFGEFIAGTLLIPFVAQLWVAPIQMFYFNNFATYSFLANIAITPFIMIISFFGFLGSILAMIPLIADKTVMVFDFILNPVVSGLVNISDFFSGLPHSLLITPHPELFQIIPYYAALLAIGFLIKSKIKHPKLMAVSLILPVIFGLSLIKFDNGKCEVLAFSVGNADSFLIKTPQKKYILIDTAHGANGGTFSQADAIIGKYLKDNGIRHLDLMLLTHFDSDHMGGAEDLLRTFKTDEILISSSKPDSKTARYLMAYIDAHGINHRTAVNNQEVISEENLSIKTYTPNFKDGSDNENSTVALLTYGDFDMLFMADGSVKSYEKIKKYLPKNIEVLKSGHHGANKTVSSSMLKDKSFSTAIISTGFNPYGHPTPKTMDTFVNSGVDALRTDAANAVKIVTDGKEYEVYGYLPSQRDFEKRKVLKAQAG